jgi:hypothetical protein
MDIFASLFGGALKGIGAEHIIKQIATHTTAGLAKGPISELFQGMHVAGRAELASELREMADHLEKGECDAAAGVGSEIIGNIKL